MQTYCFFGPYKEYFNNYIDYKRGLGRKFERTSVFLLQELDRFSIKYPELFSSDSLTQDAVNSFTALKDGESKKTQYIRISFIHDFALFLSDLNIQAYIYPMETHPYVKSDFCPYIFSSEEIAGLLNVVDHLPLLPRYPQYHFIYPMLIRMLYGCGLRINEALLLKMEDVDMEQGVIILHNTKNYNQRLVPMSKSLFLYAKKYLLQMNYPENYKGYFYTSPDGNHYSSTPVYVTMKKYMATAGIFRNDGTPPRVHDLRHTFAVHALQKMDNAGYDLYYTLPLLCKYLGHDNIKSTEKYLRISFETRNSIANTMNTFYQDIFPEVNDNEKK